MLDRSRTIPDLKSGVNLLWAPPRSTALHQVALSALPDLDGKGVWIDARDNASTSVFNDLGTPWTLRRLRIARSWTAYQHHELVRQLSTIYQSNTIIEYIIGDLPLLNQHLNSEYIQEYCRE